MRDGWAAICLWLRMQGMLASVTPDGGIHALLVVTPLAGRYRHHAARVIGRQP